MVDLSVDADVPASMDLFNKTVSDLQENVVVGVSSISGTLKYVDDYTGFSSKTEEQSGNYLAIHADDPNADTVTIELLGGTKGPVTLDEDRVAVLRIKDKNTQSIKAVSYKNGAIKDSWIYKLKGLVLEAPAQG